MVIIPLLQKHHILTQVAGYHVETIKFLPPMTVTESDMDWFLTGLDDVLTDIQRVPGAAWDTVTGLAKRAMTA
jgi:ornithine--oxo-acid transaminase